MFIQLPLIEPKDTVLIVKRLISAVPRHITSAPLYTVRTVLYAIATVEKVDGALITMTDDVENFGRVFHIKNIKQIDKPHGISIENKDFEF